MQNYERIWIFVANGCFLLISGRIRQREISLIHIGQVLEREGRGLTQSICRFCLFLWRQLCHCFARRGREDLAAKNCQLTLNCQFSYAVGFRVIHQAKRRCNLRQQSAMMHLRKFASFAFPQNSSFAVSATYKYHKEVRLVCRTSL